MNILINGFGRIGRLVFRQLFGQKGFDIVAINDLTSPENLAYLLEHDSAQGMYGRKKIKVENGNILVSGSKVKVFSEKDPSNLPHTALEIDLVFECTGFFRTKETASLHLKAGAKKVIISAPAKGDIKTIVYGVNHKILDDTDEVISAASCTTNCLAPVVQILNKNLGIKSGLMTTVHSVTNDQKLLDLPHTDFRRGRAAINNIVPTSTGAAAAIGLVMPELKGKLDGFALRVPTITGSVVDLTVIVDRDTTVEEVNEMMRKGANSTLAYCDVPIVSTDIIGTVYGSVFDPSMTKVMKSDDGIVQVKIVAWYDNEMSYVSQLVRAAKYFIKL